MNFPLEAIADDSGIIDEAVVGYAHLVLRLSNAEKGISMLSRKKKRKIVRQLEILSEEGKEFVHDCLRESGEEYAQLGEINKGARYAKAARYFKRYYMMDELFVINGNGSGPMDYHRKSHPMREKLRIVI